MTLAEKIQKLIFDIETLDTEMPEQKLPQNVYYLNDQDIVCQETRRVPLSPFGGRSRCMGALVRIHRSIRIHVSYFQTDLCLG